MQKTGNNHIQAEDYIEAEVLSSLTNLQTLYPEMDWQAGKGYYLYRSKYAKFGRVPTGGFRPINSPKSYIRIREGKQPDPFIYEQGSTAPSLINYIMERDGKTRPEACRYICDAIGKDYDELFGKSNTEWQGLQEQYKAIHDRVRSDLFTAAGSKVLDYLHGRAWTDEDIRKAGLGMLTKDTAQALYDIVRTGGDGKPYHVVGYTDIYKDYPLVLPFICFSIIRGFKFRCLPDENGHDLNPKYKNTKGMPKSSNLLGLNPVVKSEWTEAVLVEGDLDALLAQARGLHNIVSLTGKDGHDEQVQALIDAGVKRVTIMLDTEPTDEKMTNDIYPAIDKLADTLRANGLTDIYVALLPDPDRTGMDVADYLKTHTAQELQHIIDEADPYPVHRFKVIAKKYTTDDGTFKQLADFKRKVMRNILLDPATATEHRNAVCELFEQFTGGLIKPSDLQAEQDAILLAKAEDEQKRLTKDIIRKATDLLSDGKTDEALQALQDGSRKAQGMTDSTQFAELLHVDTDEEEMQEFREMPDALPTPYYFLHPNGTDAMQLKIQQGALTIIGAMPHHGKTTMLRNIAMQLAMQPDDAGAVWFLSFEEEKTVLKTDFVNTYIGKELHRTGAHKQHDTILRYYKTGQTDYIRGEEIDYFLQQERQFRHDYLQTGKLRIKYESYNLSELIAALTYAVKTVPTKAVFIDYIQKLRTSGYSKSRQEELQDVCRALRQFAIEYRLPVILGAQMTRGITMPTEKRGFNMQAISDSSEIEKEAATVVLLWNSQYKATEDVKDNDRGIIDRIGLGTAGRMYAMIAKNRHYGGVGYDAILQYDGAAGKVHGNYKALPANLQAMLSTDPEQQELFDEPVAKRPTYGDSAF